MGIDATDVPRLAKVFGVEGMELFEAEIPKHAVIVNSFYLDRHLVSNSQFKKFADENAAWQAGHIPAVFCTTGITYGIGNQRASPPVVKTIRL